MKKREYFLCVYQSECLLLHTLAVPLSVSLAVARRHTEFSLTPLPSISIAVLDFIAFHVCSYR